MARRIVIALGMLLAVTAISATPQRAVAAPGQRQEIEQKFRQVFDSYLAKFKQTFATGQAKAPEQTKKLVANCAAPEHNAALADPKLSAKDKLAEIDKAAEGFQQFFAHQGNAEQAAKMVSLCVIIAPASGHLWAGAIFATIFSEIAKHAQEDLVAAYYGSGILGATDLARAKQHLQAAKPPFGAVKPAEILKLIAIDEGADKVASAKLAAAFADAFVREFDDNFTTSDPGDDWSKTFGHPVDAKLSDCAPVADLDPVFASSGSSVEDKLAAVSKAVDAAKAKLAGRVSDPNDVELGAVDCAFEFLGRGENWSALVYLIAVNDDFFYYDIATLYGSGALGVHDYAAALDWLSRIPDWSKDLRKLIETAKAAGAPMQVPMDAGALAALTARADEAFLEATFGRWKKRAMGEAKSFVKDFRNFYSTQKDYDAALRTFPDVGERDPHFPAASATPQVRLAYAAASAANLLTEAKNGVLNGDYVWGFLKGKAAYVLLAVCGEAGLAEGDYWSALICNRAFVASPRTQDTDIALITLATMYGSGTVGVRDYTAARTYLKAVQPHLVGPDTATGRSLTVMIDALQKAGGAMIVPVKPAK